MRNNEQFVSFMVENDDPPTPNDDYFKSLSREFYGSKSQDLRKQLKVIKSAGDLKLKLSKSGTSKPNIVLQPYSVSHQLQQQIHKLLSKPKLQVSSFQSSFKNNSKFSITQIQNRKLILPKNEDSNMQSSYRSTLNTSTKSQPRTDRALDLYQMKLKTERSVEKQMIKRKLH